MIRKVLFALVIIALTCPASNAMLQQGDTTTQTIFVITPRINSTGHFPFTGALINHNFNADINIFMERKGLGFFLFKSHDLEETRSIVNYLQPGIFTTARLSSSVSTRIFLGYLFSQANSFRDADSDYYTALTLYWQISKQLRLENTALLFDLRQKIKLADRLLLSWKSKLFKLDLYFWQREVFHEKDHSTSAMLGVTFPQLKISKSISLLFTSSYQRYLSNNRPGFALRDGFLFSLSMPIELMH